MKQTSIGLLPSEWSVVRLRDTCSEFFSGGTPSTQRADLWDGDIPWTTSAHLSGLYLTSAPRRIARAALTKSATRVAPAGNLLVGTRVGVGKTAVNVIDVAISQDLTAGIVDTARFLPEYVALQLQTERCQSIFDLRKRGATIKGIPREDVHDIEIAVPPLSEQRAIAALLSRIHAAAGAQERIVAMLEELKAATMAKLFREGLRGGRLKPTEIGEIPETWEVVRLGDVSAIERGKFAHRPRNDPRFYGGMTPFIQTGDVAKCDGRIRMHTQTLNWRGLAISRVFPKGTIVLTIAANIADTGILEFDSAFPDSLVGIVPDDTMDAEFLELYLRTQKAEMNRLAPKGTQKNINIQFLKPWPTPQPSLEEQREIARVLRALDGRVRKANQRLEGLRSILASMLDLLMTGQVRVGVEGEGGGKLVARRDTVREKVEHFVSELVRRFESERVVLFGQSAPGSPSGALPWTR